MRVVCLIGLFLISSLLHAGVDHLLPMPQSVKKNGQLFAMGKVSLSTPVWEEAYRDFIHTNKGEISEAGSRSITVFLVDTLPNIPINENEAYTLSVTNHQVQIKAISKEGVYWALQTLRQLIVRKGARYFIEGCEITDYPAFRIRGFMQDVGRTYMSIEELKREIKQLSAYKINTFHWHLTEDLGWRLESKIFPMLNDSVNFIRQPGQFYTLEEAKGLVDFCKQHNVLLIPEIEMPGHSLAFRKAFRHEMQSKEGMAILKLLMDEVCDTFDVPYIHIGTDEVQFTNPDFVPEMVRYCRDKGKKVISWNPG